jgi:protein SCO1/2
MPPGTGNSTASRFLVLLWTGLLLAGGCHSAEKKPAASASPRKEFQVKGVIVRVADDRTEARIRHEEIPGYMKAMTMPFAVRHTNELAGLKPHDIVTFNLVDTGDDGWIEAVKKIGEEPTPAEEAGVRVVHADEQLKVGDMMPDCTLTNQLGQSVRLASLRGRAVAITFIFTTCPFPTFCPRMSDNFEAVQKELKEDPNGPKNWTLWSITMDPETDTPSILKSYGRRHKNDPAHWSLLTGSLKDITALGDRVGLTFWRAEGTINHNLRTVVIDTAGRVQAIIPENKWTPDQLVAELRKAAAAPVN